MQVGTTKDQGLYNKPSAAVHPGALAAGTLPQYSTIQCFNTQTTTCLAPNWPIIRECRVVQTNSVTCLSSPVCRRTVVSLSLYDLEYTDMCTVTGTACC